MDAILHRAIETARACGAGELRLRPDPAADHGTATLAGDWGEARFTFLVRPRVTAAAVPAIAAVFGKAGRLPLLLTERVGATLGDALREAGIRYLDVAGNAWLDAPGLCVRIEGRRLRTPAAPPRRLFRPAGLKLLYLLLRDPQWAGRPQRELAELAGIALGNIPHLLRELREGGFLEKTGPEEFAWTDGPGIRARWEQAYLETLRPKLVRGGYRLPKGMDIQAMRKAKRARPGTGQLGTGRLEWGGELGAAMLTRNLRPETATLHAGAAWGQGEFLQLKLIPELDEPQVWVLEPLPAQDRWAVPTPGGEKVADPLLLRVELLRIPDPRCQAQARALLAEHLPERLR